jgi:hypothetical protein
LKNKGFKEENVTKFGGDAIGMSTTLESNKSLPENAGKHCCMHSWSYWSDKTLESNMSLA